MSEIESEESIPENRAGGAAGIDLFRRFVALMFLLTLFVSRSLWMAHREYPLTPIWSGLPQPPRLLDQMIFWILAASLAGVILLPNPRLGLRIMIGICVILCALDQSRWQPYTIHYLVLLACMLLLPWEKRESWTRPVEECALLPCRLLLVFTYLYSGLHKVNYQFATDTFPWLIEPLNKIPHIHTYLLSGRTMTTLAMCAAGLEALGGFLLIWRRTRRAAVILLIGMHLFIMGMIGPLGHNWNHVVWPWNFAMMAALLALFWRRGEESWTIPCLRRDWWKIPGRRWTVACVLILFGALPTLCFVGRWDSYLSFSLYSGALRDFELSVDIRDLGNLPASALKAAEPANGAINLDIWSITELRAVPYPEDRIALSAGRWLAERVTHGPVLVQLSSQPNIFNGRRKTRYYRCPIGGGPAVESTSGEYWARR